jgi:hypothetical protein
MQNRVTVAITTKNRKMILISVEYSVMCFVVVLYQTIKNGGVYKGFPIAF